MTGVIFRWGGTIGGVMVALLLVEHFFFPVTDPSQFDSSETYGYVAIFASLAIMYLAILDLEKKAGDDAPTMWQKIMAGSGAALIGGAVFGLYNVFYTEVLNPDFMDSYYNYYISQLLVQSGPEYEQMVADLEAQKEMFQAPITQFGVMAATVVMIGIPMSVLLALLHKLRG